jgi:hypothetical protein
MYAHFMQDRLPPEQRGIFIAGDDVSWTPAWAEGLVQTSLNAAPAACTSTAWGARWAPAARSVAVIPEVPTSWPTMSVANLHVGASSRLQFLSSEDARHELRHAP